MKKKEQEANVVSYNRPRRINYPHHSQHRQVAAVTPVIIVAPPVQTQYPQQRTNRYQPNSQYQQPQHQQPQQQQPQQQYRPPQQQRKMSFDPIPMSYTELYPALIAKNLVQLRQPPPVPEVLP